MATKPAPGTPLNTGLAVSANLIGAYLFGEGSGTTTADAAASPANGTLPTAAMWGSDADGTYLASDGSTHYFTVTGAKYQNLSPALSVFLVLKTTSVPVGVYAQDDANAFQISTNNDHALQGEFLSELANVNVALGIITDGGLHVIGGTAVVGSPGVVNGYVDGALINTSGSINGYTPGSGVIGIGAEPNGAAPSTAKFYGFYVYSEVATSGQIAALAADPWAPFRAASSSSLSSSSSSSSIQSLLSSSPSSSSSSISLSSSSSVSPSSSHSAARVFAVNTWGLV